MTSPEIEYVIWVTRDDASEVGDAALRERAGLEDSAVRVHTKRLRRGGVESLPRGSRDEWGTRFSEVLNVGYNQLPPEGQVYVARHV